MQGFLSFSFLFLAAQFIYGQAELEAGFQLLNDGNYPAAQQFFADTTLPTSYAKTVSICYARALGLGGEAERALDLFKDLKLQYPTDVEVAFNVAEALMWTERYQEAKSAYSLLLADNPASFVANYGFANAHAALDEDVLALEYMNTALSHSPENQQALIALNAILLKSAFNAYKAGRYTKAQTLLNKIDLKYIETAKIEALNNQIVAAVQSNFELSHSQDKDSEENSSKFYGLAIDFGFAERHRLSMQSFYRQLSNIMGNQAVQQGVSFQDRIKLNSRLEFTGGIGAIGSSFSEATDTRITTLAKLSGHLHEKLFTEIGYAGDNRDANVALLESQLLTHNFSLTANYMLTRRLGLYIRAERQEQSDSNNLMAQVFSLYYTLKSVPLVRVGCNASWQSYKFMDTAYFSPEHYRHLELFTLVEKQTQQGWQYRTMATLGHQTISDVPLQLTYKFEGRLGYAFKSGMSISGHFNYNSAAQINTGGAYAYMQAGLNLRYSL